MQSVREKAYVFLATVFVTSLVTANLVFQKIVDINLPVIDQHIQVSVGLFFFPITFVITDVISEIYGEEKAEYVVILGLVSGVFVLCMMILAQNVGASSNSSVTDRDFNLVFGNYGYAILASLIASFIAQIIDVKLFLFLKKSTNSKHLWLRNNVSTIIAQCFDTFFVMFALFYFGALPNFWGIFKDSFQFKVIFALLDTPLVYLMVHIFRKRYKT